MSTQASQAEVERAGRGRGAAATNRQSLAIVSLPDGKVTTIAGVRSFRLRARQRNVARLRARARQRDAGRLVARGAARCRAAGGRGGRGGRGGGGGARQSPPVRIAARAAQSRDGRRGAADRRARVRVRRQREGSRVHRRLARLDEGRRVPSQRCRRARRRRCSRAAATTRASTFDRTGSAARSSSRTTTSSAARRRRDTRCTRRRRRAAPRRRSSTPAQVPPGMHIADNWPLAFTRSGTAITFNVAPPPIDSVPAGFARRQGGVRSVALQGSGAAADAAHQRRARPQQVVPGDLLSGDARSSCSSPTIRCRTSSVSDDGKIGVANSRERYMIEQMWGDGGTDVYVDRSVDERASSSFAEKINGNAQLSPDAKFVIVLRQGALVHVQHRRRASSSTSPAR